MTDIDLDAIKAAQARVYAEVSVYEKGDAALGFLDSGVVDDLVAEVKRLRAEADDAATEAVEAIRLLGVAELEVEMLKRALAEARAAIARVEALCDHNTGLYVYDADDGRVVDAVECHRIRAALQSGTP